MDYLKPLLVKIVRGAVGTLKGRPYRKHSLLLSSITPSTVVKQQKNEDCKLAEKNCRKEDCSTY